MQFFHALFALRRLPILLGLALMALLVSAPLAMPIAHAQTEHPSAPDAHGEAAHSEGEPSVFEPEHGTWLNGVTRFLGAPLGLGSTPPGGHPVIKYDYVVVTALLWLLLALALTTAARRATIRPVGKASSLGNTVEWAVESFQDYLIGVMGEPLGRKYTAFLATFFFTILFCNWLGLIPGLLSPSAIPVIPIALAIVGFIMVHVYAIREAGFKSWIMHFVGEPLWLAPLNVPLHIIGELIKPVSLSLRLLCNVFGEEKVIATLTGMAILFLPVWLPIPIQFPMLILGTFFGFLQALVFATLLAIYIVIFATHHDEGEGHPSTEHAVDNNGHHQTVGHPAELIVG